MIIRDVSLTNFRSFKNQTNFQDLRNVNTLVGPNMAGKSNLFAVFGMLKSLSNHESQDRFIEHIFDMKDDSNAEVSLRIELSNQERAEIIKPLKKTWPQLVRSSNQMNSFFKYVKYNVCISKGRVSGVSIDGEVIEEKLHVSGLDNADVLVLLHTVTIQEGAIRYYSDLRDQLGSLNSLEDFCNISLTSSERWNVGRGILNVGQATVEGHTANRIKDFIKQISILSSYRRVIRSTSAPNWRTVLKEDGSNAMTILKSIRSNDQNKFYRIIRELKSIYGLKNITLLDESIKINEKGLKTELDFSNMSYGLQQSLILLLTIWSAKPDKIICIEEPELHLHPYIQRKFIESIKSKSKQHNCQFFITTHSPIFTTRDECSTTFLITRDKAISNVMPIISKSDLDLIKQELGINNSDMFGDDIVLCLEGESEYAALPLLLSVIGTIDFKSIRYYNLRGINNVKNLPLLLKYLKFMGTRVFMILDRNSVTKNKLEDFVRERLIEGYQVWNNDFEDAFDIEIIFKSMRNLATKNNVKFEMKKVEEPQDGRIYPQLKNHMESINTGFTLNKPQLAREIAQSFITEFNNNKTRNKTEFESKISKIIEAMANK